MNLQGKKILVTGGAGFIGSHLCRELVNQGAIVSIIDNLATGKRENISKQVNFVELSINDPRLGNFFLEYKPEIVFHLAFNTNVPASVKNPLIEEDSLVGSIRLFELASQEKVKKMVFTSSEFIYGNTPNLPTPESEPVDPLAPYAISKNTIENYLLYYHRSQGLPGVVLRYATVYGPGQSLGAMTDYIRQLSRGGQADIWGDGSKTREYIFIDDIVRATIAALDVPDTHMHPVFNVGTGVETTLLELYRQIATILNREAKPIFHKDRPGEQMRCLLKSDKVKSCLNWSPKVSLTEGLKIKIEEFLKNPC